MAATDFARAGVTMPGAAGRGIHILATHEIPSIARAWTALAGRPGSTNPFLHPEFAIPAVTHLGGKGLALALARSASGTPTGLAVFRRTRLGRVAPAVRLWTHKYAPFGEPLVDADDIEGTLDRLVEGLAPSDSGTSLILPEMAVEGPLATALGAIAARSGRPLTLLGEHRRAMLTRGHAVTDLRAGLGRGKRKELGRQLRRLNDLGAVNFTSDVEADCVLARFEEFLALEQAGWKGERGTALVSSPGDAAFAREALFNLAQAGKARIDSLRIGTHPVAIVVSLVAGTAAFTWKTAFDERYARHSPGVQLMLEVPESLLRDPAVCLIDSCAVADHSMIDRLWPERRGIATFVLGPRGGSALHAIGLKAAQAELAARANVRQLRDRLG